MDPISWSVTLLGWKDVPGTNALAYWANKLWRILSVVNRGPLDTKLPSNYAKAREILQKGRLSTIDLLVLITLDQLLLLLKILFTSLTKQATLMRSTAPSLQWVETNQSNFRIYPTDIRLSLPHGTTLTALIRMLIRMLRMLDRLVSTHPRIFPLS